MENRASGVSKSHKVVEMYEEVFEEKYEFWRCVDELNAQLAKLEELKWAAYRKRRETLKITISNPSASTTTPTTYSKQMDDEDFEEEDLQPAPQPNQQQVTPSYFNPSNFNRNHAETLQITITKPMTLSHTTEPSIQRSAPASSANGSADNKVPDSDDDIQVLPPPPPRVIPIITLD